MITEVYFSENRDSSPRTLAKMMMNHKDSKFASFWLEKDNGLGLGSGVLAYKGKKPSSKEIKKHVKENGFLSPIISTSFYGRVKNIEILKG